MSNPNLPWCSWGLCPVFSLGQTPAGCSWWGTSPCPGVPADLRGPGTAGWVCHTQLSPRALAEELLAGGGCSDPAGVASAALLLAQVAQVWGDCAVPPPREGILSAAGFGQWAHRCFPSARISSRCPEALDGQQEPISGSQPPSGLWCSCGSHHVMEVLAAGSRKQGICTWKLFTYQWKNLPGFVFLQGFTLVVLLGRSVLSVAFY